MKDAVHAPARWTIPRILAAIALYGVLLAWVGSNGAGSPLDFFILAVALLGPPLGLLFSRGSGGLILLGGVASGLFASLVLAIEHLISWKFSFPIDRTLLFLTTTIIQGIVSGGVIGVISWLLTVFLHIMTRRWCRILLFANDRASANPVRQGQP